MSVVSNWKEFQERDVPNPSRLRRVTSNDTLVFDGATAKNATADAALPDVLAIEVEAEYKGTITVAANLHVNTFHITNQNEMIISKGATFSTYNAEFTGVKTLTPPPRRGKWTEPPTLTGDGTFRVVSHHFVGGSSQAGTVIITGQNYFTVKRFELDRQSKLTTSPSTITGKEGILYLGGTVLVNSNSSQTGQTIKQIT